MSRGRAAAVRVRATVASYALHVPLSVCTHAGSRASRGLTAGVRAAATANQADALTLPTRFASFDLVVSSTPPSTGVTSAVFAFARPEYFHELMPVGLLGSMVNSAPRLPITLVRPDCLALRMWHEVSRTTPQMRSGDALAMTLRGEKAVGTGAGSETAEAPILSAARREPERITASRSALGTQGEEPAGQRVRVRRSRCFAMLPPLGAAGVRSRRRAPVAERRLAVPKGDMLTPGLRSLVVDSTNRGYPHDV